ncbi:MAG: tetratricopeptide repeat protein [Planctomycetota bacterium]|jgi:tetratricopeptide (TPR) repeat protein|nr:tetratricopeptide repeat protein [Planctomycetota bacterium]
MLSSRRKSAVAVLLAALLALAPAAVPAESEEEAEKYQSDLRDGVELLKNGSRAEVTRAIAKFKSALKIRPDSAEAYYWIGVAYSDQNNYLRAADNAKDATIYDERLAEAWLLWGQTLLYQKDWPGALEKLETAERLAPDDPMTLFNLGRVYYHGLADPGAAYAKFNRIWQNSGELRRENPENAGLVLRARLYMGYCEFDRGNWANAINAFQDVLREEPDNYPASLRLGLALRRSGRARECESILWELLRAVPDADPANRQLRAEINLQLADLYLKEAAVRNGMLALTHLREFVGLTGDLSHPALEPAREYLARNARDESLDG